MKNRKVVNEGSIGNVQDHPGDDDTDFDFDDAFTAGFGTGGGVINTGVTGPVQNGSGSGNTQNITYGR